MSGAAIRLVVKSRRRLVREAICGYLAGRPEFAVVGQAGSIEALAEVCALRRPDAALVDAVQLTTQKVDALLAVRAAAPQTEVVVTYAEVSPQALEAAVNANITALVPCSRGLDAVLRRVREHAHAAVRRRPDGLALTGYDLRIVSLLSSGHTVPEMARLLKISARTVDGHKRRLYAKLGVHSASHAVAKAASLGLIDSPATGNGVRVQEAGRAPLAVVRGPAGPGLDRVLRALLAGGVPFVHARTLAPLGGEHWARWHRGPIVAVLVDPTYDDWLLPTTVGAHTVAVLTKDPDLPGFVDTLLHGARAVVRAGDATGDLASLLDVVVRGYVAVDATRIDDCAGWMAEHLAAGMTPAPALTTRERGILESMACGHTIRQTAKALGIAAKTVENLQARLFLKLGAHSRAEAVTVAHRTGLLELREP